MKRPRFCYWIHSTLKEEVQITFVHILLNFANHNLKTIVELEVHPTLLKRRGSKTTARGGGTLGGAGGGKRGSGGEQLGGGHHPNRHQHLHERAVQQHQQ